MTGTRRLLCVMVMATLSWSPANATPTWQSGAETWAQVTVTGGAAIVGLTNIPLGDLPTTIASGTKVLKLAPNQRKDPMRVKVASLCLSTEATCPEGTYAWEVKTMCNACTYDDEGYTVTSSEFLNSQTDVISVYRSGKEKLSPGTYTINVSAGWVIE